MSNNTLEKIKKYLKSSKRKIDTSKTRSGVQPFMDSFFKKRNKER